MKVKKVLTTEIRVPEVRVTAVYDEHTAQLLKDTIAKLGILQPIIVVKTDDGYELVDGLHRLQEAKNLGDLYVDCVVYEGAAVETLLMNLVLNKARGKTKVSEMLNVVQALYEKHGMGIEEIEERTGLTRSYIENLLRIARAAPCVQTALDEDRIGLAHALEIIRLPTHVQQEELVAKQAIYSWKVTDLREVVNLTLEAQKQLEAQPAQKEVRVVGRYYCEGCKQELEARYLKMVQLCPECFGQVWRLAKSAQTATSSSSSSETE
jgi:ParB family chromosome partitioning protein